MYLAAPGQLPWYSTKTLAAASTVTLQLASGVYGCSEGGCVNVVAWTEASWNDGNQFGTYGWTYNCCIFATMTTIAQAPVNVFNDGAAQQDLAERSKLSVEPISKLSPKRELALVTIVAAVGPSRAQAIGMAAIGASRFGKGE